MPEVKKTSSLFIEKIANRHWIIRRRLDGSNLIGIIVTKARAEYCLERLTSIDVDWDGDIYARFASDRGFSREVFDIKRIALGGEIRSARPEATS